MLGTIDFVPLFPNRVLLAHQWDRNLVRTSGRMCVFMAFCWQSGSDSSTGRIRFHILNQECSSDHSSPADCTREFAHPDSASWFCNAFAIKFLDCWVSKVNILRCAMGIEQSRDNIMVAPMPLLPEPCSVLHGSHQYAHRFLSRCSRNCPLPLDQSHCDEHQHTILTWRKRDREHSTRTI
jgi:hypothetical protein